MCLIWLATDVANLIWMDSPQNFKPVTSKKKKKENVEGNSLYLLLNVNVSVHYNYDLLFKVCVRWRREWNISRFMEYKKVMPVNKFTANWNLDLLTGQSKMKTCRLQSKHLSFIASLLLNSCDTFVVKNLNKLTGPQYLESLCKNNMITLGPCPHVSGHFWIRNFFFPDTATVRRYPVNSTAYPDIFKSAHESEKKLIRKESDNLWTGE